MRKLIEEFKEFILGGDVVSMSIGFVVASAFTQLIDSFTSVFLTPLITLSTNGIQFQDLSFTILNTQFYYGRFINSLIVFLITGFILFILMRAYNRLRATINLNTIKQKAKVETAEDYLREIRDMLRQDQPGKKSTAKKAKK